MSVQDKGTVIILDDDISAAKQIADRLKDQDLQTLNIHNVSEFAAMIEQLKKGNHAQSVKAIVIDMELPFINDLGDFGKPEFSTDRGRNAGWAILKNELLPWLQSQDIETRIPVALMSSFFGSHEQIENVRKFADGSFTNVHFFEKRAMVSQNAADLAALLTSQKKLYTAPDAYNPDFPSTLIQQNKIYDPTPELIAKLQSSPDGIDQLSPRQFEEVVAELLDAQGWDVTLTPQTRDGGVDIFAYQYTAAGPLLCVVDAKRYRRDRTIDVGLVRSLLGTVTDTGASFGMIATTSSFTSGARAKEQEYRYRLSLRDFRDIASWIQKYRR